jgi:hypothetical protein
LWLIIINISADVTASVFRVEDGNRKFICNVGNVLTRYTAPHATSQTIGSIFKEYIEYI